MAFKLWVVSRQKNMYQVIFSLELILMFGATTGLAAHVDVKPTTGGALAVSATMSSETDPDFIGPIQNVTVAVGREAVLSCTVTDLGNYRVGWMKAEDQTILTLHTRVVTHNARISVSQDGPSTWQLRIRQLKESDRGCYMCQINTSTMKKQFGCIDVQVPPDISDGQTSGDVSVQEGDNSTMVCRATGRPQPRILWRREDGNHIVFKKGPRDITKVETFAGESLTLLKLDRKQMGAYLCIASNDVPPAVSKRITLNVNFKPTIIVPNQLLGAPLGTDVNLECFVEAFPNTINYWVKNRGDVLLTGKKHIITEVKISTYRVHVLMTITNFTKRDLGTYMCIATNSLGKSEGTIRLYEIKIPTLPPATTTTTTTTQSTTSTSTTTEVASIRRKVLIPKTTTSPKRQTTTQSIEENLILSIDRSGPKEYFYNYASSSAGSFHRSRIFSVNIKMFHVFILIFLLSRSLYILLHYFLNKFSKFYSDNSTIRMFSYKVHVFR